MAITAVMIDQREPDWVKALSFGNVPTTVALLAVGDVHVVTDDGALLVCERKTPDDLLNSLRDGRLMQQCANMVSLSRWSYLIITGELHRGANDKVVTCRETDWGYGAVQGGLLSIQEMGAFVVFAGGDSDFENCITRLANRRRDANTLIPPVRPPIALRLDEVFLCGLPGIGPERAQKLLDYTGSAKMALIALTDPDKIPGIPASVQREARRVLGMLEREQMCATIPDELETLNEH